MKQAVVPYTISVIRHNHKEQLDHNIKFWKNQQISQNPSDFLYDLMKQVNQYISPCIYAGQHYIEQSRKEECRLKIKNNCGTTIIDEIKSDLIDEPILQNEIYTPIP